MSTHFVLVYGSLKKTFHNHDLLWECGSDHCRYLGNFSTSLAIFEMRNMSGSYPLVFQTEESHAGVIDGELYEVSDSVLANLDMLEGHPTFYKRTAVDIDNFPDPVYMYITVDRQFIDTPLVVPTEGHYRWDHSHTMMSDCLD